MTPEVFFHVLWPTISGLVIVPLTQWIKSKIPADIPIGSAMVMAVFNGLSIAGLNSLLSMGMSFEIMWPYITAGISLSVGSHSLVKTKKKLTVA